MRRRAGWQDRAQQAALSSRGPLFLSPVCQPPLAAWLCGLWTGEASVPRQRVPGLGPSTGSSHTLRSGRAFGAFSAGREDEFSPLAPSRQRPTLAPGHSAGATVVPCGCHPQRNGGLTAVEPRALRGPCRGSRVPTPLMPSVWGSRRHYSHFHITGDGSAAGSSAPGSWRLGFHLSSRWFCLKTPERGREDCMCLVSSPQ